MSLKELRKEYPAYPLSVLKRALEINPDKPDIGEALREYAKGKESSPTPFEFYYVLKLVDNLRMVKVATQVPSGEKLVRRLAWQALTDDVDELSFCEAVAKTGQYIKIFPVKKIDIVGNVSGYLQKGKYLVIVGLEVEPKVADTEVFAEVINTLTKNALAFYLEYKERSQITEHMPTFKKFFLDHVISFYDSIFESPITSFQTENRTMADYLRFAPTMLDKDAINLVQLQVIDMSV